MSDDIVTRLREGKGDDIALFGMMYEAADEIERLRALVDELYKRGMLQMKCTEKIGDALDEITTDRDRWKTIADELYTWLDLSYDDESVHEAGLKAITIYEQAVRGE